MSSIPAQDAPGECQGSRFNEDKDTERRNQNGLVIIKNENAQRRSPHDRDCEDRSYFGASQQEVKPFDNKNGLSDVERCSVNDQDSDRQSVRQDANHDHAKRSESLRLHGPYHSDDAADSEGYVWPPPEGLPGPSGTKRRILSARRESPCPEAEADIKISKSIFENSPERKEDGEMSEPEELDVKPFSTRVIAVEETTEAQKRLMNIFHFPSAPLPDVAPPVEPKVEPEEPPPPKRAHYNRHTEDEQRQYVESNNASETEAPAKIESVSFTFLHSRTHEPLQKT